MSDVKEKRLKRYRRHKRVRSRIYGTSERPRLSVFRSNRHVLVQLIDDEAGVTIVSAGDTEMKGGKKEGHRAVAERVGALLAKKAVEKGVRAAVFDRGGYKYHGLVKAVAEGVRKGGLKL